MSPSFRSSRPEATAPSDFETLFAELEGRWRLVRRVSNGARFSGFAEFGVNASGSLILTEAGKLQLPGSGQVEARRKWHWVQAGSDGLEIRYPPEAGGGSYHALELHLRNACGRQKWRGEASHPCGADVYRGFYSLGASCLLICHHVTGPSKNYTMASLYLRRSASR